MNQSQAATCQQCPRNSKKTSLISHRRQWSPPFWWGPHHLFPSKPTLQKTSLIFQPNGCHVIQRPAGVAKCVKYLRFDNLDIKLPRKIIELVTCLSLVGRLQKINRVFVFGYLQIIKKTDISFFKRYYSHGNFNPYMKFVIRKINSLPIFF